MNSLPSENQNTDSLPELLTPKQAAEYLGVTAQSVRNYEKNGYLTSIRIGNRNGGDRRFHKVDIIEFKNNILCPNESNSPRILHNSEIEYSNKLMAIAKDQYEASQQWKGIVNKIVNVVNQRIDACLSNGDDDAVLEFASKQAHLFNYWSLVYDRAIKWESKATGLDQFIDINTAANTLRSQGYIVIDPSENLPNVPN